MHLNSHIVHVSVILTGELRKLMILSLFVVKKVQNIKIFLICHSIEFIIP